MNLMYLGPAIHTAKSFHRAQETSLQSYFFPIIKHSMTAAHVVSKEFFNKGKRLKHKNNNSSNSNNKEILKIDEA